MLFASFTSGDRQSNRYAIKEMPGEGFPTNCQLEWLQAIIVGGALCLIVGILSCGVVRLFL